MDCVRPTLASDLRGGYSLDAWGFTKTQGETGRMNERMVKPYAETWRTACDIRTHGQDVHEKAA